MTKSTTVVSAADIKLRVLAQASLGSFGGLLSWYIDRGFSADRPLALLLEVIQGRWSDMDRSTLGAAGLGFPVDYVLRRAGQGQAATVAAPTAPSPPPSSKLIGKLRNRASGAEVVISIACARLLQLLMVRASAPISSGELGKELGYVCLRSMRSALKRLRDTLAKIDGRHLIVADPGVGYRLDTTAFWACFADVTSEP